MGSFEDDLEIANSTYNAAIRDLGPNDRNLNIGGIDFFNIYFDEMICLGVYHFGVSDQALDFFFGECLPVKISDFLDNFYQVYSCDPGSRQPLNLDYRMISLVHLCWLLGEDDHASRIIPIDSTSCEFAGTSPEFIEYARILTAFGRNVGSININSNVFSKHPISRFRFLYAELMQAFTNQNNSDTLLIDIDRSFMKLNGQKAKSSMLVWEGCKENPAKWDFRKESILSFASRHY